MASRRQQLLPLPTARRASPRLHSYFAALGYEITVEESLLVRGVRYLSVKVGGRLLQVALDDSRTPQPEVPTQERSGCGRPAAHGVQVEHLHRLVAHRDGVDAAPRQPGDHVVRGEDLVSLSSTARVPT